MQDFRNLKFWGKAHSLVIELYSETKKFPKDEMFALTSQLRRAVASVPTNIAEGCGRETEADFKRFLVIAMGSASEVEYLLLLSKDLNYLSLEKYKKFNDQIVEIKKMISTYINKIKTNL